MSADFEVLWFLNRYKCERCHFMWNDQWSVMCNDRCPECHIEMEPYDSVDLSRELEESDYEFTARRLPSPLWPTAVVEVVTSRLEGR